MDGPIAVLEGLSRFVPAPCLPVGVLEPQSSASARTGDGDLRVEAALAHLGAGLASCLLGSATVYRLRLEGWLLNDNRVQRIWREEVLQ